GVLPPPNEPNEPDEPLAPLFLPTILLSPPILHPLVLSLLVLPALVLPQLLLPPLFLPLLVLPLLVLPLLVLPLLVLPLLVLPLLFLPLLVLPLLVLPLRVLSLLFLSPLVLPALVLSLLLLPRPLIPLLLPPLLVPLLVLPAPVLLTLGVLPPPNEPNEPNELEELATVMKQSASTDQRAPVLPGGHSEKRARDRSLKESVKEPVGVHYGASGLGGQVPPVKQSSKSTRGEQSFQELRAALLASYEERRKEREAEALVAPRPTSKTAPIERKRKLIIHRNDHLYPKPGVEKPLVAQPPTSKTAPIERKRKLIIHRNDHLYPKPQSVVKQPGPKSILKQPGAPKTHKSICFSEYDNVRTFQDFDESYDHILYTPHEERAAPRPVSWTTGSLNAPILHDTRRCMWMSVRDGDEVMTFFRYGAQRQRVCQVRGFYRAQLAEDFENVTSPRYIEVTQTIDGFYGSKIDGAQGPMWTGVILDSVDPCESALPTFSFGVCIRRSAGYWYFLSEAYQCHDGKGIRTHGRYQCEKGGNCLRFSFGRFCGCEGHWFKRVGRPTSLKTQELNYTPWFESITRCKVTRSAAVQLGRDGITVVPLGCEADLSILTEQDVAPPHPRPSTTARHHPRYPVVDKSLSKTKVYRRPKSSIPSPGTTIVLSSRSGAISKKSKSTQLNLDGLDTELRQRIEAARYY
ncbi:hypothetical protein BDW02DRAFT_601909, partial [Decorospora gaudefroyi]